MTWRRFETIGKQSTRFWNIRVLRNTCIVHYGQIGNDGQKRMLECEDAGAARKKRDRLIRKKLAGGYVAVDESDTVAALRNVDARLKFHRNGRLRAIGLMNRPCSSDLIPFVNRATTLKGLSLRLTTFDDADLMKLNPSQQLTGLDLYGTRVTDEGLKRLPLFRNLKRLDLSSTAVSDRGVRHLARLVKLQLMSLHATRITDASVRFIKACRLLETLYLGYNGLTDRCLPYLAQLSKLQFLHLDETDVSDDGLHHLKELKLLRGVALSGTRVTSSGAEQLHSWLPDASVLID